MPTSEAPAPAPAPADATPATSRPLFLTLPVRDLSRAVAFYEALGFAFEPQFASPDTAAFRLSDHATVMLGTHARVSALAPVPIADPRATTGVLLALGAASRAEVDALVERAVAQGGEAGADREDHGFMYEWSFRDLDGHGWGLFWMNPEAGAEG